MADTDPNNIVYPSYLKEPGAGYPFMSMTARDDRINGYIATTINLPIPSGLAFSDGGEYGTIDGAAALGSQVAKNVYEGKSPGGIGRLVATLAADMIPNIPGVGAVAEAGKFAAKIIKAPNTNATFTGNTSRDYSFTFEFVPTNATEAATVKQIRAIFQKYTYGAVMFKDTILLTYPPVWEIKFHNGDGSENKFIPRIFGSYLKSVTTTINSQGSNFHADGSPITTQLQLSFQEARTLNRGDIERLENEDSKFTRGIDPDTGLATVF